MIEKISNLIVSKITDKENISQEKKEIILFGVTRIVEDIPKTIGIIIVGLILGIIQEMIIVTLIILIYKSFVGGVHCKNNLSCFICSLMFYLATIYSSRYITFTNITYLYICMFIFALYTIFTYVPADVPEVPKVDIKIRKTLKINALISLLIIHIITICFIKNMRLTNLIISSVFYTNLMATRTMYKLFKNEYGYETYIPEQVIEGNK